MAAILLEGSPKTPTVSFDDGTGLLELITAQSPDDLQPDVAHAIDAAVAGLPPRPDDAAEMGYSGA